VAEAAKISIDEAVLIEQCQAGDSAAMERLILKYQNRIFNVILKMCGNVEDAAELTQDTFVKIIQNIAKFESKSSFYTWAFRIAVNLTLNYCQRSARLGLRSLDSEDYGSGKAAQALMDLLSDDSSPDPANVAQNKELCEIAVRSLMKMDDDQRMVIVLRDIEGMNYAQIAGVLQIKLGTVRSRLSRARSRLREVVEAMLQ